MPISSLPLTIGCGWDGVLARWVQARAVVARSDRCIIPGVDRKRLLECIAADAARLREVAGWDLAAPVPTCPDWTVADLVRHVANGYLNVVVRRLRLPEDRPVQDLTGEQPVAALDCCYSRCGYTRDAPSGSSSSPPRERH